MLSGKRVSLKTVISKVYRDLQLKEEDVFLDMIEWGAEALEFIGAFQQLDYHESEPININLFKAELPLGFVSLVNLSYNGVSLIPNSTISSPIEVNTKPYQTPTSYNQDKIENVIFNGVIQDNNIPRGYSISNGYIHTPYQDGILHISYTSIPIDCEGYPLVPDNVSYIEAVYRYIVYKWMYAKVLTGQISPQLYKDAEERWQWYCNQAGAQAMMPDLPKLENIARNYLKLKPEVYQFDSFFANLNK